MQQHRKASGFHAVSLKQQMQSSQTRAGITFFMFSAVWCICEDACFCENARFKIKFIVPKFIVGSSSKLAGGGFDLLKLQ